LWKVGFKRSDPSYWGSSPNFEITKTVTNSLIYMPQELGKTSSPVVVIGMQARMLVRIAVDITISGGFHGHSR